MRLHYVEAGHGPLVLMYHGFPSFWYSWFPQMEALKANYHVVAVDGLGAGLSAKPTSVEPYRVDRLARQVDRLARHLAGRRRFVLIGHDWGAALAFAYAQAYPRRLTAVVGMSAPPYNLFLDLVRNDQDQQARSSYMQRFRSLTLPDIHQQHLGNKLWQQAYAGLVEDGSLTQTESDLFRASLSDPLAVNGGMNWYRANIPPFEDIRVSTAWPSADARIRVPALLIWGEADRTFVPAFPKRMTEVADHLTILSLPDVGHWTTMQRPTRANDAIIQFLGAVDQTR